MANNKKKAMVEQGAHLPVSLEDLTADANLGGRMGVQDVAIPYLSVLQTMSPQVNPDNPKYIEGAKAGMFYLSALEQVFDGRETGLTVVLCHYERLLTEWRDRDAGGGLVGWHEPDSDIVLKAKPTDKGGMVLPNTNILTETAYHYILVNAPGNQEWWQAVMPLKSTGLKISKKVNYELATTRIPGSKVIAPRFLYAWSLKSVKEQKDQYVWSNVTLKKEGALPAEVYQQARSFALMAAKGTLKRAAVEEAMEASQTSKTGPAVDGDDDAVPF